MKIDTVSELIIFMEAAYQSTIIRTRSRISLLNKFIIVIFNSYISCYIPSDCALLFNIFIQSN
jgi:hypothetical protein